MISAQMQPLVVFLALLCGAALGQFWRQRWILRNRARLRQEARSILREAERTGQGTIIDAELRAKEIGLQERRQLDHERGRAQDQLLERERMLAKQQELIATREANLQEKESVCQEISAQTEARAAEIELLRTELLGKLHGSSGLTLEEAQRMLMQEAAYASRQTIAEQHYAAVSAAQRSADEKAREIITTAMERVSTELVEERSVSLVPLPSDDMRGRIVGRDGRNIRAFETITGVDVLLDEIPGQIMLSCHNPERRETARVAMLALVEDGRIQPSRIEEFVKLASAGLEKSLFEQAQLAAQAAAVINLDPAVMELLGRLHLRRSFAQNVLAHSVETAQFAVLLGQEIGLDRERLEALRRAALLHDIGKALSGSYQGPHALVGAEFLRRFESSEIVLNAIAAHHGETEDLSVLCPLLRIADKLSGGRPGARREDLQDYIKRLQNLEQIALGFSGVKHAYALRAGRELQLVVSSQDVSDAGLYELVQEISQAIRKEYAASNEVEIHAVRELKIVQRVCHLQ